MIYLDYAATTPMHPQVIRDMTAAMAVYGNPSSIHQAGRAARKLVDDARRTLAQTIGAKENEIIFTSGGTEADNTAIFGVAYANQHKGKHIITSQIEHHAVLHACEQLEREGFSITYLPVDSTGCVRVQDVKEALHDDTILVTIMLGNNEVGTIQPIAEISELLQMHQAVMHTDAVQAYGMISIDVNDLQVDYLSVSSHKINGPKGIGFLYQRTNAPLQPLLYGGQQERKRRATTENVPAIVGFATASTLTSDMDVYERYKQQMQKTWQDAQLSFTINGAHTLPHILNVSFTGVNIEALLVNLDMAGICASSGSACTAGAVDPSHVLVAMYGADSDKLHNSVRFSFGYGLTAAQVQEAAVTIANVVQRLVNL